MNIADSLIPCHDLNNPIYVVERRKDDFIILPTPKAPSVTEAPRHLFAVIPFKTMFLADFQH